LEATTAHVGVLVEICRTTSLFTAMVSKPASRMRSGIHEAMFKGHQAGASGMPLGGDPAGIAAARPANRGLMH